MNVNEIEKMRKFDQLVGAYYSPEVEEQKSKAWRSLRIAIITGFGAVALFALYAFSLSFSILFQINLFQNIFAQLLFLLGIPLLLLLVPISLIFSLRYIWACKKAKDIVDSQMRRTHQNVQGEVVNSE